LPEPTSKRNAELRVKIRLSLAEYGTAKRDRTLY
jgi:hypothetical protein